MLDFQTVSYPLPRISYFIELELFLQCTLQNLDVWVSSAKHEADTCNSMTNARSMLQRGLRFNPESQQLWLEVIVIRQSLLSSSGFDVSF